MTDNNGTTASLICSIRFNILSIAHYLRHCEPADTQSHTAHVTTSDRSKAFLRDHNDHNDPNLQPLQPLPVAPSLSDLWELGIM